MAKHRSSVEGYAILRPTFSRAGKVKHTVIGVGLDIPTAWGDAAYSCYPPIDAQEFIRRNPNCKMAPCLLRVAYELPE